MVIVLIVAVFVVLAVRAERKRRREWNAQHAAWQKEDRGERLTDTELLAAYPGWSLEGARQADEARQLEQQLDVNVDTDVAAEMQRLKDEDYL